MGGNPNNLKFIERVSTEGHCLGVDGTTGIDKT